jgi:acyl carrier protein
MNEAEIRGLVIETLQAVAPEVDAGQLDPELNFRDQFDIDSVDFLNFVLKLEARLGIRVPELDYPKLSSLTGCLHFFQAREVQVQ